MIKDKADFRKGWNSGLPETICGAGSTRKRAVYQARWIGGWAHHYRIRSVLDIGAGDLNWIDLVRWPKGCEYHPVDLVPRHESVTRLDITGEIPKPHDMVMAMWVLNHMPEADCAAAIDNIRASGSRWFAFTWAPWMWPCNNLQPVQQALIWKPKATWLRLVDLYA